MTLFRGLLTISLLLQGIVAVGAPRQTAALVRGPAKVGTAKLMSSREAEHFMATVLRREQKFYQPGIAFDGATGLTFDGHPTDFDTGKLRGGARVWSAASKESLHLILLTKAIGGEPDAQTVITPDPKRPELAKSAALDILERKIASYEKFDREYPGYGGFLPWYKVEWGKVTPTHDWKHRVPGLDNGQLAWSLYFTAARLKEMGETKLAARYEAHLAKMKANVVRVFYDPVAKKMRAEAKIDFGNAVAPHANSYSNNVTKYFLDDSYEGLLLCHFADLMGDWSSHPEGREPVFAIPRRTPVTKTIGHTAMTATEGNWLSSHEDWGDLVLPYRDVPVAATLYKNEQRVRTKWAELHGHSGVGASTHKPGTDDTPPAYVSAVGVQPFAKEKVATDKIFAPYAAFPLALVNKRLFATWLSSMLKAPGMFGEYGMNESYSDDGRRASLLTWDGKALPVVAWMGGIAPDVGRLLQRDGLYDEFRKRVQKDFSKFDGVTIKGTHVPYGLPQSQKLGTN